MSIMEDFMFIMGARADRVRQGRRQVREVNIIDSRGCSVVTGTSGALQPSGATMTDEARIGGRVGAAGGIGRSGHGGRDPAMVIASEKRRQGCTKVG